MKPGLSLRTSQQLTLTPQLQQAIRLLQLSTQELASEVEQMLQDNPFLERADEQRPAQSTPTATSATAQSADTDTARSSGDLSEESGASSADDWNAEADAGNAGPELEWGARGSGTAQRADDDAELRELTPAHESLAGHLHRQALALRLSPEDAAVLGFLIESLDDDGYLQDSLAQLAATLAEDSDEEDALDMLVHRFKLALRLLQAMDPPGVGARDLSECLRLQLMARQAEPAGDRAAPASTKSALALLAQPEALEWLARRDLRRMAQATGLGEDAARAAQALIASLEPKPGRRFADVAHNAITPDVIVSAARAGPHQRLAVQLNPEALPRLRVSELYASALRGERDGAGHAALSQQLQEARWFVRNIQQRFDTILRVARAIVDRQQAFFMHGELAMKPLVQRELAEELGVHESTISRVTSAKYMATPRGTFEFKYFFGSALATEAGGNASSTAVRELIRQLIAGEDPARPLSDGQIADLLKAQGIACARRTVAKYREGLRIATATLRKAR